MVSKTNSLVKIANISALFSEIRLSYNLQRYACFEDGKILEVGDFVFKGCAIGC